MTALSLHAVPDRPCRPEPPPHRGDACGAGTFRRRDRFRVRDQRTGRIAAFEGSEGSKHRHGAGRGTAPHLCARPGWLCRARSMALQRPPLLDSAAGRTGAADAAPQRGREQAAETQAAQAKGKKAMSSNGTLLDLHTVEFKRLIPGPIELAWDYLTKPELLKTWFADVTLEARVGGAVNVRFSTETCGGGTGGVHGIVREFRRPHVISFPWIQR